MFLLPRKRLGRWRIARDDTSRAFSLPGSEDAPHREPVEVRRMNRVLPPPLNLPLIAMFRIFSRFQEIGAAFIHVNIVGESALRKL